MQFYRFITFSSFITWRTKFSVRSRYKTQIYYFKCKTWMYWNEAKRLNLASEIHFSENLLRSQFVKISFFFIEICVAGDLKQFYSRVMILKFTKECTNCVRSHFHPTRTRFCITEYFFNSKCYIDLHSSRNFPFFITGSFVWLKSFGRIFSIFKLKLFHTDVVCIYNRNSNSNRKCLNILIWLFWPYGHTYS